jgi:hypothetical protein
VAKQYRLELSVRVAPPRDAICWIIKQSEETESVCVYDKLKKGRKQFCSSFA